MLMLNKIISIKKQCLKLYNCAHIKLLVLYRNIWNHLTDCKRMNTYKYFPVCKQMNNIK